MDVEDDDEPAGPPPSFTTAAAAADTLAPPEFEDDDDMLRAALDASLRTEDVEAGAPSEFKPAPRWASRYDNEDDEDDDYNPVDRSAKYHPPRGRGLQTGLPIDDASRRVRRSRPRAAALPDPYLDLSRPDDREMGFFGGPDDRERGISGGQRGWPPALIVDGQPVEETPSFLTPGFPSRGLPPSAFPPPRGFSYPEGNGNGLSHLPDGINMEEARMLEAAMLGIPYEGRIPDFNNPTPPEPVSPTVIHHRQLREEQDQAYHDSLQADERKADAAEVEKRIAEEEVQKQQRQDDEAAQAQRSYEQEIEDKLLGLPIEPSQNEDGAITVLVRTPKGGRFGRRFRRSDPFSKLFDFVDVSAAPDFRPGQYRLVTQFPRRVFELKTRGSLEDGGLSQKQEAVFLEPL